jgi:hypothetical protein
MDATRLLPRIEDSLDDQAPFMFLVSTTGCAGDLRRHMGSADYSYGFVLNALTPVLETVGHWKPVPAPESSLAFAAAEAAANGYRPIHLALHPLQNAYLTPAVPTVLFPFWEFPRLPDRDFGYDTRQNWVRTSRAADLVLCACRSTANAFRAAGVACPVAVVPVPLDPKAFELPDWDSRYQWSIECRHFVWEGRRAAGEPRGAASLLPRSGARARIKDTLRDAYRKNIKPWLSPDAIRAVSRSKRVVLRQPDPPPPLLPSGTLVVGGLVYTSVFNLSDRRKNAADILTAFLRAFRDRADVTLVLKLVTSASREFFEVQELGQLYGRIGTDHACRVVVVTDYLTDSQMLELLRVTTFYVNASRAEGACLPLQQALAAGRPGLAPVHTAMDDYLDQDVGFVLESHPEPTYWPHDPSRAYETSWHRLVWDDLRAKFQESAGIVDHGIAAYRSLARNARQRMGEYASREVAARALRRALAKIPPAPGDRQRWVA